MFKMVNRDSCSETKSILDIEGYGQVGMVVGIKMEKCGKNRIRLIVELTNKQNICSPCIPEAIAKQSMKVLELYSKTIKLV
uniref:Uncharacterized protein n=1 Tax=Ignisphaera aggregans TaxID=334771 RepID=A0A7C4H908_9CREN